MDYQFTEEQNALRDNVRKMMDRIATPEYIRRVDQERLFPYELSQAWAEMGLYGVAFPEEYGGFGGTIIDMMIISEEIARKSYDFVGAYNGVLFCGLNVFKNGTEAQKNHWIPKLLSGQVRMTVSMSEPDAGSDTGAMRTTARREGDHYVINGQKLWSSGAGARNNVINLYCRTTDLKSDYRKGTSLFLVDNDAPGVTLRKLDMLGRRSVGTYEIFFDNVKVPADRLIGGENGGWGCMLSGLQYERTVAIAAYVGGAQAVVDMTLEYARERKQFGKPIGSFQAIAHMLADMQTEVAAARALMWQAARMVAAGQDALKEISMAKLFASETFVKAANQAMQIYGAAGYSMEYDIQRFFRDARGATIAGGTSQIQRNLIARLMNLKIE
ncbi:MAG: acyl-CoA dehydrogenase family protein [Rhodocyclaceae bacterium]|nr:acyl-CoA dehydrogenase family protein [Rhodocyclaceae bacterium]